MKRTFLIIVMLIVFSAASLSAWSPNDLTKYPSCMSEKDWIINFGVGLGLSALNYIGSEYIYVPPVRLSFDKNVAMGDKGLPFFIGGLVGYSGFGRDSDKEKYYHHRIPLGVRVGYHFNWGVDKLDTYAVTTVGYRLHIKSGDNIDVPFSDQIMFGVNFGARWFVSKGFGFWAEAGYVGDLNLDLGLAFKF